MTLDELRSLFPHTREMAYLDHASTGPLSTRVMDALAAHLDERHRTNPNNYLAVEPALERARERLAALIGAHVERVDFAPNTSDAINVLAQGYPWQPGDRVAVPACEFPANVFPFLGLAGRGVSVDFIEHRNGTFTAEDVERALRPGTRVVSVSWVQFLSGFRCDLPAIAALCRDRGIWLAVDAIQGLGALRLEVEAAGVDFLASGAQKWLLGMQGSAFFYVSEALQERLTPVRGWLNGPVDWTHLSAYDLTLHDDARRFRTGTLNIPGIVVLDAALGLHFEARPTWCEARVLENARRLSDGLARLGLRRFGSADPAHASGIVTVEHEQADALLAALDRHGVKAAVRDRKLRLSPTYYNSEAEIDRALAVVEDFAGVPAG